MSRPDRYDKVVQNVLTVSDAKQLTKSNPNVASGDFAARLLYASCRVSSEKVPVLTAAVAFLKQIHTAR